MDKAKQLSFVGYAQQNITDQYQVLFIWDMSRTK